MIDIKDRFVQLSHDEGYDATTTKKILAIIKCESGFDPDAIHYNRDKVTGELLSTDHSYWQINSGWKQDMADLGLDITDPEDNIKFGFFLFKKFGDDPWRSSKKCWQPLVAGA